MNTRRKKVVAVASAGGHWQQLMRLRDAFSGHDVHFATTLDGLPQQFGLNGYSIISDCNRNEIIAVLKSLLQAVRILIVKRPDLVITTGALPGLLFLAVGKMFGARTIWVDSVANAEEFSLSGRSARRFADLWMSQWNHVAEEAGATYKGSVL